MKQVLGIALGVWLGAALVLATPVVLIAVLVVGPVWTLILALFGLAAILLPVGIAVTVHDYRLRGKSR